MCPRFNREEANLGTITNAYFTGNDAPKNQIRVNGIGLKANASEGDIELWQSVLGDGHPTIVIISDTILCEMKSGFYTSDKGAIKIRMQGDDGNWTN
jgi:hypothetical protein